MKLSICIPVYNGAASIGELIEEIDRVFKNTEIEVILVNDGSPSDNSSEVCQNLVKKYSYIKFIDLRKNFGENNAVMCALNYCTGDYAAVIDDDLQNPPEEIFKLLNEIEKGYDVVYAKYHKKMHSLFRNFGSKVNDIFATLLMEKPKDLYLCTFRIISRPVINEIIKYKGPFPYIDGLILRVTRNISAVYVDHKPRAKGKSNYTLAKLINVWLNMFINFSIKPMRFIMSVGIFAIVLSFALGVYFVVDKILHPEITMGITTILILILFFGGLNGLIMGFVGEYIGKNYLDQNGTPQYIVKAEYNV